MVDARTPADLDDAAEQLQGRLVNDVVGLRFQVKTTKLKFFEEEHSVNCEGIVKWSSSKDNRTGIEFHQLEEEVKMLIHRSLFDEIDRQIKRALKWA